MMRRGDCGLWVRILECEVQFVAVTMAESERMEGKGVQRYSAVKLLSSFNARTLVSKKIISLHWYRSQGRVLLEERRVEKRQQQSWRNQIMGHQKQQCTAYINNLYMIEYWSEDRMRWRTVDEWKTRYLSGDTTVYATASVMVSWRY